MTYSPTTERVLRAALVFAGALCFAAQSHAQTPPIQLPRVVTMATRTPADTLTIGSAIDLISADDLARRQIATLGDALGAMAGAPLFASGARGALTSVFLRGANSNQTLFLVDGIRLNDPNTDYAVFLGGARLGAYDSLEVARGPQSTLHGGEAVGGVVSLHAARGSGAPAGRISIEAGSFGTVQGALATQGEFGPNALSLSLQGGRTANDRPNNGFDSAHLALRLDRKVNPRLSIGGTLRGFHGVYGDPGDRFTNDPDNESRESNVIATAFADFQPARALKGRVVLGAQHRRFVSENPGMSWGPPITVVKNRRAVFDAQATYSGAGRHRLTGGVTAEENHASNNGFGDIDESQGLFAVFLQDEMALRHDVFLTAGLRNDDFDTFGRATTGRFTAAWLVAARRVKLRATFGTAFRSPSFLDLYGRSAFYNGNPDLRPERAEGWDAGVDHQLPRDAGVIGVTFFGMRHENLIAATPDFTSVENIQRARTRGVEVSARVSLPSAFGLHAAYTWLEAENLTAGTRLLRRPRHRGTLEGWRELGAGLAVGAGLVWTAQREDVHARDYVVIDGEDFTVARFHAAWDVSERFGVKLRIENLLDEHYEEVHGYPAPGFGAFAGAEWKY